MTFGFRMGVKVLSRQKPRRCATVRGILTSIQEPPVDSSVPEHPCTLILAQDDGLDDSDQWKSCFETVTDRGFSQAQWSTQATDLDSALVEMGQDLSPIPSPVWIARGPWTSWMAQFYLESLHLSGLVLVDPLPLDQTRGIQEMEAFLKARSSATTAMFQDFANHWDHWTLKLEPAAVPMMVISTKPSWKWAAEYTAERHSIDDEIVPIVYCSDSSADGQEAVLIETIMEWVNEEVI